MDVRIKNFSNVPIVWTPNERSGTLIRKLLKHIEEKYKIKFSDYWDFHQWTVTHLEEFWGEMWDFTGIICSKKYDRVFDVTIPFENLPKWFEGAKLNFAENLCRFRDDRVALIVAGEDRETEKVTYAQMYEEAKLYTAAFRKFGIKKGDYVMCYMSNRKEAIIAMIATVSIGAIWTGTLPQIGYEAVINRVSQVQPKLLITVDRFLFNNEEIEMLKNVEKISEGLSSLQKVIIVPSKEESKKKDISHIRNSCFLDEFLEMGKEKDGSVPDIIFEQVSFSYPVIINYTSGTTGIPKALLNGCGMLLLVARDYVMQTDCQRGDIYLSISPVGWASWCIFSSMLFQGLTILLYEGTPFFLSPTHIWDLIHEFRISHLLLMASVVDELDKKRYIPTKKHDLSCLKTIICGGAPVKLRSYDFIYNELKLNTVFGAPYGCTEAVGITWIDMWCTPIRKGESSVPSLGVQIEIMDETTGKPVKLGEIGEIVLVNSFPGVVLGLYGDEDGSAFREKYFSKYPGKFFIGDNGVINPITKGLVICGRCDETLKQRACRFGSSEIYNVVEHFPEIFDSICVSQYNKDLQERAVLFLKMKKDFKFSDHLVERIRKRISQDLTPRHVPDIIIETTDIPFNINGKKMEILVKKIINNFPYKFDSVNNPESLKCFQNRPELQDEF